MANIARKLYFSRLKLSNWRNFVSVDVDLQPRVFIIGPNAAGKSNFLDVFRFLQEVVTPIRGGFQTAVRNRGSVSRIRSLAAHGFRGVEIKIELSDFSGNVAWVYSLRFTAKQARRPGLSDPPPAIILSETISGPNGISYKRPDKDDRADPLRLTQTMLEQVNVNKQYRELVEYLKSIEYFHLVPELIRSGKIEDTHLNSFGADFLERVNLTPEKTRDKRLGKINTSLSFAVPQLEQLKSTRDARGRPHLEARYKHWRQNGSYQNEEDFSDGTIRLLGMMWALLDSKGPVLFEEPELSLNSSVVQYIPQVLSEIVSRVDRQVMLSTHSYELLSDKGIALDEVIVLKPSSNGTNVAVAMNDEIYRAKIQGGSSVGAAILPSVAPRDVRRMLELGTK